MRGHLIRARQKEPSGVAALCRRQSGRTATGAQAPVPCAEDFRASEFAWRRRGSYRLCTRRKVGLNPWRISSLNQQSREARTSRRSSRVLGGNPGYKSHLRLVTILCGGRSKPSQDLPLVQSHPTNFGNKSLNSIPPQQWRLRPSQCPPPSPAHRKQRLLRGRPWGSPVLSRGRALDLC